MAGQHISDEDLERYYLGMVTEESELASLEEHLLAWPSCGSRAEEAQDRVDAIRAATMVGGRIVRPRHSIRVQTVSSTAKFSLVMDLPVEYFRTCEGLRQDLED